MNRRQLMIGGTAYALAATLSPEAKAIRPISLDTARGILEWPFKVKAGLPINVCQTGEPYKTFVMGGIKGEGEPYPYWTANEQVAIEEWFRTVTQYSTEMIRVGKGKQTLYWRTVPELVEIPTPEDINFYTVYSRFVISDLPEVYTNIEDVPMDRFGHRYVNSDRWTRDMETKYALEFNRRYPLHQKG